MTKPDEVEVIDVKGHSAKHTKYYPIRVNGQELNVSSPLTPEDILIAAALDPGEYELHQKLPGGETKDLPPGKKIDLSESGIEHFVAVQKMPTVHVKVVTTSGTYPKKGYDEVKAKTRVSKFLHEAAKALNLTDVTNWVATVGGNSIDPEKTFAENGLTGKVEIQWGPPIGGGGC